MLGTSQKPTKSEPLGIQVLKDSYDLKVVILCSVFEVTTYKTFKINLLCWGGGKKKNQGRGNLKTAALT